MLHNGQAHQVTIADSIRINFASSNIYDFREFFALHISECVIMSCDNKCKIPVGVSVVIRLSSIRQKFFMSGQQPNHADHDIRTGRLINPGFQNNLECFQTFNIFC